MVGSLNDKDFFNIFFPNPNPFLNEMNLNRFTHIKNLFVFPTAIKKTPLIVVDK